MKASKRFHYINLIIYFFEFIENFFVCLIWMWAGFILVCASKYLACKAHGFTVSWVASFEFWLVLCHLTYYFNSCCPCMLD